MTSITSTIFAWLSIIWISACGIFTAPAFGMDAGAILKQVDETEKHDQAIAMTIQTITTSDGGTRQLKIKSWSVDTNEKQLLEYIAPKRVLGVKILMLDDGDDIWSYSPRTRRTRHLASHAKKQKVMGSDFSYEDMGGGKMIEKYTGTVVREEAVDDVDCYVLDLTPTPKGPSYDKVMAWVGKSDFFTRKIDYYDDGSTKPIKTLYLRDIRTISGHITPMDMLMINHEDGGRTHNRIESIDYDTIFNTAIFNSRRLDRK